MEKTYYGLRLEDFNIQLDLVHIGFDVQKKKLGAELQVCTTSRAKEVIEKLQHMQTAMSMLEADICCRMEHLQRQMEVHEG